MMCCPFHHETTPSFGVSTNGVFHCFSCGEKGRIQKLVAHVLDTTYAAAETFLNPYENGAILKGILEDKVDQEKEPPQDPPPPPTGHIYLVERGIPWEVQKRYEVWVDREKQEIVFPIRDVRGRVIGEKRRSIIHPRVFRHIGRKNVLYGAYYISNQNRPQWENVPNRIFIVEGEVDVLALASVGESAVALMGAHMTDDQYKNLLSLSPRSIVLALDADDAGRKATEKLLRKLYHLPTKLFRAVYPPGVKDPAEAVANNVDLQILPAILPP